MIGNFAALAFDVGMILFWFAYIEIWVKGDAADSDRKHGMSRSAMSWAIRILFIAHIVNNVIGLRTGWFFYYDAAGAYHRGPYFSSHAVLMVIMTVMVEAYLFRYRRRLLPSAVPFLAVFPVAPFVFGMLQMTRRIHLLALPPALLRAEPRCQYRLFDRRGQPPPARRRT